MTTAREACLSFDEDLSALRDGELGSERAAEVEAHVEGCEHCRARLATFAAVDANLRGLPAPCVCADLESRVLARVAGERTASAQRTAAEEGGGEGRRAGRESPAGRGRAPRRPGRSFAVAVALATAAAALVVYLGLVRSPGPLEPEDTVAQRPVPQVPSSAVRDSEGLAAHPADLDALSDEDLSVAIDLETLEDLEVITNLEILEELGASGGKDRG